MFRCNKCNIGWDNEYQLRKHYNYGANHALTCYLCNIKFENSQIYNTHVLTVHNRTCNICNIKYTDAQQFKHHLISNHDTKNEENDSDEFSDTISRIEESKDEESEVKIKNKLKNVTTGGRQLRSASIGSRRKKEKKEIPTINEIKPFVCPICEKTFDIMKNFSSHMFNSHIGVIECEICHAKFDNVTILDDHINLYHSYKIYKCDICSNTFTKQKYYELHFNGYCNKK